MNNDQFLSILKSTYINSLINKSSSKRFDNIYQEIKKDLSIKLGEKFKVSSDKKNIDGKYYSKKSNISIKKEDKDLVFVTATYAISNYKQNSINYFEQMMGETANLRANKLAYFNIIILHTKIPYFKSNGEISRFEDLTSKGLKKYETMSNDYNNSFHAPDKTLIYLIDNSGCESVRTRSELIDLMQNTSNIKFEISKISDLNIEMGGNIIINDYQLFLDKIVSYTQYLS